MSNSKTSTHLVSIIVPIYNAEKYLAQCLDSVQAQTYANLEILCINDGSKDNSLDILHARAAHDNRITVIDKANAGYGAACNLGLATARGDWISIVEPDDYLEPRMYEALLAQADALGGNEHVDIVRSAYWRIFDSEKGAHDPGAASQKRESSRNRPLPCAYKDRVKPAGQPFFIGDGIELLLHHPSIWSAIYRREFLLENKVRFKEIPGAGWADNPFLVASHCAGARLAYVDEAFYCYRENGIAEARDFARRAPLVPLERWNDMMDEAERRNITDERVLRALTVRGVNYALLTKEALEERAVHGKTETIDVCAHKLLTQSTHRLRADLVFSDARIGRAGTVLVAEAQGLRVPKRHALSHMRYLISEGWYRTKTGGAATVLSLLKSRRSS